ncbi:MAG: hypothetical protein ACI9PY_000472 [Ascidiaceihabitans sp.]|jgi:hypothetical protein
MMDRRMMLLVIGLVFGSGIGFLVAASNGVTLDGHDHASGHNIQDGGHDHTAMQPISLASGAGAPTLAATVVKDPMSGWNLQIIVTNFRFTPQSASLTHVDGEGHAHAYVNGEKIARVYGNWLHIETLPEGDVTIEVALNSNDHRPLAVGDDLLRVSVPVSN